MPVFRLNHAVLFVSDLERSVQFYGDVLGFVPIDAADTVETSDRPAGTRGGTSVPGAAFLRAPGSTNDHDLGLFALGEGAGPSLAGRTSVGLYHLAWEVDTLADLVQLRAALAGAGALVGASDHSTTKSLYGRDPDGLEFEVCWVVPADQLDSAAVADRAVIRALDLDREMDRYGAHTPGGVGISRAAPAEPLTAST